MRFFRLGVKFISICFLVLGLFEVGYSQGCNGVGGAGISGGATSTNLGILCANIDALGGPGTGAEISITAGNVVDGDVVSFAVFWDDGSTAPVQPAVKTGPNTWVLNNITHYFPTTGAEVKCEYVPRVTLIINGIPCTANFGSSPKFTRWNVDNENSGILTLTETVTNDNIYLVCRGTETTVTFTDRSTLNCVPPEPPPNNTNQRWRRFTYGTANSITSATGVEISGVLQAFPFVGAVVTANPSQDPLPPTITLPITVPDDAQVGEEFEITMEYWNTCNPFPGPPVTETAIIRIIDAADRPVILDREICFGDLGSTTLNVTNVQGGVTYRWYPTLLDAQNETNVMHTGNNFSPTAAQAPVGVNDYFVKGSWGLNSCVSPIEEVELIRRENIATAPPALVLPQTDVCPNTTYTYRLPNDPATEPTGGATEFIWSVVPAANASILSGQGTKEITLQTTGTLGPFTLRVIRSYVNTPICPSNPRNTVITVRANPAPAITPGSINICEGEVQALNGNPNVAFGGVSSNTWTGTDVALVLDDPSSQTPNILPTAPAGSYNFTYTVVSGIGCTGTDNISVIITPGITNVDAGPAQDLCFAAPPLITTLAAETPSAGTGTWSYVSGPDNTPTFSNVNITNSTVEVDNPGVYVFQWEVVSGSCTIPSTVQIDFGRTPDQPTATTPLTFCGLTGTLAGSAPTFETAQWSFVSGPGSISFSDDTSPTSDITATVSGTYRVQWTFSSGSGVGACSPKFVFVDVTFNPPGTASVPIDFRTCVDQTTPLPIDLSGGSVGGGSTQGRWQIISGSGTIQSSGVGLGNIVTGPAFLDRYVPAAGETSVQVRLVAQDPDLGGPCGNVNSLPLTISIDRKPADADAGVDFAVCNGDAVTLAAVAATNGGQGEWSPSAGVADINDPSSAVTGLSATATFTWTVRSANDGQPGACSATSNDVIVTVRPLPAALDPTPNDLCETNEFTATAVGVTLAAYNDGVTGILGSVARTVKWYDDPLNQINDINEITIADITNLEVLFTRVIDTSNPEVCESLGQVTFTVNSKPIVNLQNIGLCEELPPGTSRVDDINLADYEDGATILLAADRTITWHTSFADAENDANPLGTPGDIDITSNTTYYARIVNNATNCFNVAQLNLTINPRPVDQDILGSSTPCRNATELYRVNQISGAQYIWDIPPQFTKLGGGAVNDFYVLLEFPTASSGDIKVTISLNGCLGNERIKPVTVSPDPTPFTIVLPSETICAGGIYPFSVTPDNTGSSTYNWQIFKQSDGTFGGGIVANGQTTGDVLINVLDEDIIVRVTESNASGCAGSPQEEPVVINQRPTMDDATLPICSGDMVGIVLSENATSPVPAITFDVQVPTVLPGIAPITGPTIGLGLLPDALQNDSYKNQTSAPVLSLLYRVTPISALQCKGTEKGVTININAEPLMDTSPVPPVCSDSPIEVTFRSAVGFLPADQFVIESIVFNAAALTLLTPAHSIGTLVNANEIFNDRWENITNNDEQVIYNVRPYSSLTQCYGNPPIPIQVTIQRKPMVTPVTIAPICSGDVLNIPLQSDNVSNATFIWTAAPDPNITGATGSITNTITDQLFNTTLSLGSVVYSVRASNPTSSPLCIGPVQFITVDVKPSPLITTPLTIAECSDNAGGNSFVENLTSLHSQISTEAGVTYSWFTDENDSTGSKIPSAQITAYTLTDEIPVYVRVRNPAAASGCAKVATVTYDVRPTPELTVDPVETADNRFNITCNGLANGQIGVLAQYGTNHTFSLNGGMFIPTALFSGLPAASHDIRVRNSEGCFAYSTVILVQPDPIVVSTPSIEDVSCFNDPSPDGEITISATGGTFVNVGDDPLMFSLLQDPSILYDAGTQTFSGLRAASYTVRVEDKNGCTKFVPNIIVGQPNDLALSIDITSDYNGYDVSCNGKSDGAISVLTTTGGTPLPNYFYTLLDENMNPTGNVTGELNGVFTGLSANILYFVQVRDGEGCEKTSIPEFLFDPIELNAGAIGFDKDICEGGDPTAFQELAAPFGGIDMYTFEWLESSDNVTFIPAAGVRTNSTYDPPTLTSQMFYKRSVTSGTCLPVETNAFKVVVHTKPTALLSADPEVCEGQTFTLNFTFSNGQAPYFFDYNDGVNTYNLIGAEVRPVPISNYNVTRTYTLTHLRDFYGCEPDVYPASVTPRMINMNNVFSVDPTLAQCSGGNFTFSYIRYPDVEYVWSFNDGSVDRVIPAFSGGSQVADTVQHIFRSVNVSGDTKYPVTLKARSTAAANCESQSLPQNVTVSPTIYINAVNDKDEICSGETVTVINSTLGGTTHRWFYRTQNGNPAEESDLRSFTTPTTQSFILTNNTAAVVTYEIVYQVSNGSCSDEIILPVIVHRAIAADMDTLSVTKYIGGNAFASFVNTSVPQDPVDFQYEWQFDAGSVPTTFDGIAPPQIRYTSIGEKKISLVATNQVAEAAGLSCTSEASMTIFILLPSLYADFEYIPQATCFPADIEITRNLGTGNVYEWKLREVNESTPFLVSNDSLPTFRITFPGVYVIEFKTTNTITGQSAEADNSATPIEIFDVPFATFEARPKTLYIPDEELIITNRSTDANQYDWDFGDGEKSMDFEPKHLYGLEGKYEVTLVAGFNHGPRDLDGDGIVDGDLICYDTARQEINAREGGLTRIPNAFTPSTSGPNGGVSSGGSFNDVFIPITKGVEEFEMTIFDRWGNLIFQTTNKNIGWDGYDRNGVLMPAGVYVYKLTMRLSNDQRTTQVGDVTLIR